MLEDDEDSDLRRERRAKMAQLRRQLDPSVLEDATARTSAPTVRKVSERTEEDPSVSPRPTCSSQPRLISIAQRLGK